DLGDVAALLGHLGPGELRRRRLPVGRPEIGPDDAALLAGRIGDEPDLVLELQLLRLVQLVGAGAADVEPPAMIDAAQPALLVAPEIERHAAMRAELLDQADAALSVAEGDQLLAQELDAHRR